MSLTAASSPSTPDQMMNGTFGHSACAILRAVAPEKPGREKSDRIKSGRKAANCSTNDSLVSTTTAVKPRLASVRRRCASSASQASSSRIRMRAFGPAGSAPFPGSVFTCPGVAVVCGSPLSGSLRSGPSLMAVNPSIRHGLVEEQPEHAQGADRLDEVGELYWLAHVGVGAVAITGDDVFVEFGTGEDHDRDDFGPIAGPDPPEHLQPVDLGELQVEQYEPGSRSLCGEKFQRLGTVRGHGDLVEDVVLLQGPERQRHVVGVVLYQQDRPGYHAVSFALR